MTGGASALEELPGPDESLDALLRGRIRLLQPLRGARVSLDALLLADFAGGEGARRVVDLGCGTGVVGLVVLLNEPRAELVGVEIQPELARLARRNARLNGVEARASVLEADLTKPLPLEPRAHDLVVVNPPFGREGGGRMPKGAARALSRQELTCTIADVAGAARRLLRPRGRLALVFPAERLAELMAVLVDANLRPRRVRSVHSVDGEPARRVLVDCVDGYRGGTAVLAPLTVHQADRRSYTPEAARILGEAG